MMPRFIQIRQKKGFNRKINYMDFYYMGIMTEKDCRHSDDSSVFCQKE